MRTAFKIIPLAFFLLHAVLIKAQKALSDKGFNKILGYKEYLKLAAGSNLLLTAEKYKVDEANARIALSRIFPNPVVTLGNASGDITGQHLQQQLFGGVTQTIPRGGKYKQGIRIAKTEKELQIALYEDYLRVFKLDVTKRFINVLIAQMEYEKNKKTNDLLQDELRKKEKSTEISQVELYRIKIEAGQILDQMYQSEEALEVALYELYIPLSNYKPDSTIGFRGSLQIPFRYFNLDSIVPLAVENRSDVILAKKKNKLSQEHFVLAKANRKKDIDIEVGNNYYTEATNYIGPTPSYHAITALISFPIAFSNLKHEDIKIAELQRKEAQMEEEYIQNIVRIEIYQSYDKYIIAWKQLEIYKDGLIDAADRVLQQELENYKTGKSSFLDLSESHRKLDEVYLRYFDALKTFVYSLIELEDDMGIWDLEF